jgi:hypothetical protein
MKYSYEVKLPKPGDMTNEVNQMAMALKQGVKIHWGNGEVKGFTIPLNTDGTPATQLGYLNMLVEAPVTDYLKDWFDYRKRATIKIGWPKLRRP